MPEPPDDARLIERSRDDPEAFAAIYDRHAGTLHRYVARRLGTAAADDVLADTFLDAFRARHRQDRAAPSAGICIAIGANCPVYRVPPLRPAREKPGSYES